MFFLLSFVLSLRESGRSDRGLFTNTKKKNKLYVTFLFVLVGLGFYPIIIIHFSEIKCSLCPISGLTVTVYTRFYEKLSVYNSTEEKYYVRTLRKR